MYFIYRDNLQWSGIGDDGDDSVNSDAGVDGDGDGDGEDDTYDTGDGDADGDE